MQELTGVGNEFRISFATRRFDGVHKVESLDVTALKFSSDIECDTLRETHTMSTQDI